MENKEDNNVIITKAFDIMRPMLAAFVAPVLPFVTTMLLAFVLSNIVDVIITNGT